MDIQSILDAIKDYGGAIISTISVGGVAGVAGIIAKVKSSIDKTKEQMNTIIEKKEATTSLILAFLKLTRLSHYLHVLMMMKKSSCMQD